jgi:DNA-binding NarL/FixJ family response regulator
MIKVLLADDHALMRDGLKRIIGLAPEMALSGEASNGSEMLDALRKIQPDLLLMDMTMPGISGVNLINRVRSFYPLLPILILSMHNEVQTVVRALKAGANGYITKDRSPDELLAALRKVATGGKYIDKELAEQMVFHSMDKKAPHSLLSDRELEVFHLLVRGKGVNEIANALAISNKTVSTHKVHLLEKLNMKSTAELVRYAVQHDLFD